MGTDDVSRRWAELELRERTGEKKTVGPPEIVIDEREAVGGARKRQLACDRFYERAVRDTRLKPGGENDVVRLKKESTTGVLTADEKAAAGSPTLDRLAADHREEASTNSGKDGRRQIGRETPGAATRVDKSATDGRVDYPVPVRAASWTDKTRVTVELVDRDRVPMPPSEVERPVRVLDGEVSGGYTSADEQDGIAGRENIARKPPAMDVIDAVVRIKPPKRRRDGGVRLPGREHDVLGDQLTRSGIEYQTVRARGPVAMNPFKARLIGLYARIGDDLGVETKVAIEVLDRGTMVRRHRPPLFESELLGQCSDRAKRSGDTVAGR